VAIPPIGHFFEFKKPAKGIEPPAGGLRNRLQNQPGFLDSGHNIRW